MQIGSTPCVAFDPHGLIFAIATDASTIRLYDVASFDKGPFAVFRDLDRKVQRPGLVWTSITFSPNGAYILVSTDQDIVFIVDGARRCTAACQRMRLRVLTPPGQGRDTWMTRVHPSRVRPAPRPLRFCAAIAFSGELVRTPLTGIVNRDRLRLDAAFTPDSKSVVCGTLRAGVEGAAPPSSQSRADACRPRPPWRTRPVRPALAGSQDGTVHVWDLEKHESIAVLRGHPSPCNVVRFNPRLAMMASACTELVRRAREKLAAP